MNARQVEAVARDLARSRTRIREAEVFATACAVVALATVALWVGVAAAFGAGAVTGALLATGADAPPPAPDSRWQLTDLIDGGSRVSKNGGARRST